MAYTTVSTPATIGALIPCYNEAKRVSSVLRILDGIHGLCGVWVVDDGSSDNTVDLVRRQFPEANLIALPSNRGKAGAVLAAAEQMRCDYVLMMDADLQELNGAQLQAGIEEVRTHPVIDMLIFMRTAEVWWAWLLRGNDLFSGERIVRRSDLVELLRGDAVQGYQLEVALNQQMIERKKLVRRRKLYCRSVLAAEKVGWQAGMQKESRMFRSIFNYLGLPGLVRQYLWFPPLRS